MSTSEVVIQRTAGDSGFSKNILKIEVDGPIALKFFNSKTNEGLHGRGAILIFSGLAAYISHGFSLPQVDKLSIWPLANGF